jgi:hypothetical protein
LKRKWNQRFFDSENFQITESEGSLIPRFSKNQNLSSLNISSTQQSKNQLMSTEKKCAWSFHPSIGKLECCQYATPVLNKEPKENPLRMESAPTLLLP